MCPSSPQERNNMLPGIKSTLIHRHNPRKWLPGPRGVTGSMAYVLFTQIIPQWATWGGNSWLPP